jgi:NAD(P)-dependent dehydrogenase (short-subunit alcohol dehydrogenase family)
MNFPGAGAYTIAKYAMAGRHATLHLLIRTLTSTGTAETLAVELEPFNIKVTCIEPGDFRTAVWKVW